MFAMHPCQRPDLEFLRTLLHKFINSIELAVTPGQRWEEPADANACTHWASVITNVTRTSPQPHGVGTTRICVAVASEAKSF